MTTYEQKLAHFSENKDFAIFNELSSLNGNTKAVEEAIKAIPQPEMPEMPEQLEEVSVKNFPDVQKVEVTNFPTMPEHKAPVVNVAAPIVKVDAPIVKVDNQAVAEEIAKITEILSKEENKSEIEKVKVLDSEGKLVDFKGLFDSLGEKIGQIRVTGGGGASDIFLKNNTQNRVNPATSENQDTQISHIANVVSTVNSTSTPLGISGVFTGTAEDVSKYASISVSAFSNRASATNGLSIQFSSDGTNWDNIDAHTTSANVSHVTTNAVQHKYFRVVYTNGTTAQTSFRLQTIYSTEAIGPIIEEMGGDVSDTTSTLTTKAVLFAKNPAGVYGAINRTTGGNLKMSLEEIDAGVALPTTEASYDTLIEEASATITYIGKAVAGTTVGTASWQIKRIDTSSGTVIRFADGVSTFTKVWNNRATYTY